ncbi:DUF2061 domain-containing protein [Massilia sp. S19_KUP03_FR1]|uniref:DUF2061 domain-containing protein n=1 Tax=Massilia sp. S19_KUP03_FR1 TaxID=3025503 RepID=UPI002FCD7935
MFTATKRVSQVAVHMGIAFALASTMSGSVLLGGLAVLAEPVINVVLLPFHEKAWHARIRVAATERRRHLLQVGEKVSQTILHATVAFNVMWIATGSMALGGLAALVEPICNVIILPYHDRLWDAMRARLSRTPGGQALAAS